MCMKTLRLRLVHFCSSPSRVFCSSALWRCKPASACGLSSFPTRSLSFKVVCSGVASRLLFIRSPRRTHPQLWSKLWSL
ncbi:uncharacterized protein F5891DRAFT_1062869 [Suillus fuscotomentosus]|uniref:Uncharacterized protein n=1 Tax=Suillus fuscotomentosus TaxID=1912939 RepID=A0AAD4DWT0_9AGAM|nr:uncharacterized protein F5891DRAFT_1062869 [Suillus fuscotomentosus]KAG1894319.1 hypothetical protein F5891DRAFT_1062869 [Suillus fuscotomentosus]